MTTTIRQAWTTPTTTEASLDDRKAIRTAIDGRLIVSTVWRRTDGVGPIAGG